MGKFESCENNKSGQKSTEMGDKSWLLYSKTPDGAVHNAIEHAEWAMELSDKFGYVLATGMNNKYPIEIKFFQGDRERWNLSLLQSKFTTMLRYIIIDRLNPDVLNGSEHAKILTRTWLYS